MVEIYAQAGLWKKVASRQLDWNCPPSQIADLCQAMQAQRVIVRRLSLLAPNRRASFEKTELRAGFCGRGPKLVLPPLLSRRT